MVPQFRDWLAAALLILFSSTLMAEGDAPQLPADADVRIVIDISGSMKKNDPNNLRVPALNLLVELIPDGNSAGVWTFGQFVNNLVKREEVTDAWRAQAKEKAKQINSVALFTNIGGALEVASDDFFGDRQFNNTHFILLTDGVVDIDPDPAKNATERQRILNEVLQKITERGAKIHSVALSENADGPLLEKLSVQSGGLYATAENSADLTRIFLQAFDQAVPTEQVPLEEDNGFDIDSSVEEFTALVFRQPDSAPTRLIEPTDKAFSKDDHPDYIKWFQQGDYDLITVQRPLEGEWKLDANLRPDSRVTVVSNLRMNVGKLPANFFPGQVLDLEVSFFEEGSLITNPDFLSVLDIKVALKTPGDRRGVKDISGEAIPSDGVFRDTISKLKREGQYEVTVLADGKTFKRQQRQVINLQSPFDIELEGSGSDADSRYDVRVTSLSPVFRGEDTSVVAKIKSPDASSTIRSASQVSDAQWTLDILPVKGDGEYEVKLLVKSKDESGADFQLSPDPITLVFPRDPLAGSEYVSLKEPEPESPPGEEAAAEPAPETPAEPEPEPAPAEPEPIAPISLEAQQQAEAVAETQAETPPAPEPAEEPSNLLWYLIGGGVAAVLALGGAIFALLRGRKKKAAAEEKRKQLLEQADAEEVSSAEADDVAVVAEDTEADDAAPEPEPPAAEAEAEETAAVAETALEDAEAEEELPPDDDEIDLGDDFELEEAAEPEPEPEATPEPEAEAPKEDPVPSEDDDFELDTEDDVPPEVAEVLEAQAGQAEAETHDDDNDIPELETAEDIPELTEEVPELTETVEQGGDNPEDDEFNLEEFDISETDDLPESPEDDEDDKK